MNDEIDIDGQSRRFQLLALFTTIGVLLTILVAVGAIAPAVDDPEFSIGGENESDPIEQDLPDTDTTGPGEDGQREESSNGGETERDPPEPDEERDDREENGDTFEDEEESFSENIDGEYFEVFNEDGIRDMPLSMGDTRPLNDVTEFRVNTPRDTETLWRTRTFNDYDHEQGTLTHTDSPTADNTVSFDEHSIEDSGDTETFSFTMAQERVLIPNTGTPIDAQLVSGVDSSEYEFKRTDDNVIVATDGEGDLKAIPEGGEVEVTSIINDYSVDGSGVEQSLYTDTTEGPNRVAELSESITDGAGAETNKETADAITEWLSENKKYNVTVAHGDDVDPVEEFLFNVDEGDSRHFTSATMVMLREQGVPARVVNGYYDGNPGEEGMDDVSSLDQYMWVEVYTEDEGWVEYDPVPEDREIIENTVDEKSEQIDAEEDPGELPEPPYDITLDPDPTPGQEVTVKVEADGTPVSGVEVFFNGESIGTTGSDGSVSAQVPYTDSLSVSVPVPGDDDQTRNSFSANTQFSGGGVVGGSFASSDDDDDSSSSETYDIPTNVTVESSELVVPGETVLMAFTIEGNSVPDVEVYRDDEFVGRTDTDGELNIDIPDDAVAGDVINLRVERDDLVTETELSVGEAEIEVDTGILSLPGTEAKITVVASDGQHEEPVSNHTVSVVNGNGDPVAGFDEVTIDENGSAVITLPWSNSMTATTSVYNSETSTTVSGLFYQAGAVGLIAIGVLGGSSIAVHRRGGLTAIKQGITSFLVMAGRSLQNPVRRVSAVLIRVYVAVRTLLGKLYSRIRSANIKSVLTWPKRAMHRVYSSLRGFISRLKGIKSILTWPRRLVNFLRQLLWGLRDQGTKGAFENDSGISENANPPQTGNVSNNSQSTPADAYTRIKRCWRWVAQRVIQQKNKNTKTTVEIENNAVERGLPAGPVTRLRRLFQDVEYGFDDAETRVSGAETAVETMKENQGENTEDEK